MLTVNDAGGTHNTQVTTSKKDPIHKNATVHMAQLVRSILTRPMRIKQIRPKLVGIPISDNLKLHDAIQDG